MSWHVVRQGMLYWACMIGLMEGLVDVQVLVDKNYGGGAWLRLSVQVGTFGSHGPVHSRSCLHSIMLDARVDFCPWGV